MTKRIDKEAARGHRYKGNEVYAIDLLISTWRHLYKLHDLGLSDDDGEQYLKKARELYEAHVRNDVHLHSSIKQRLAEAAYG